MGQDTSNHQHEQSLLTDLDRFGSPSAQSAVSELSSNELHKTIIKRSNRSSIAYMISAFSLVTFGMWVKCIWVLYARSFFNNNHEHYTSIDIMLYIGYVCNAISSLTNGILSDKFGCDKMLTFIVLLWEIGFLLQAFAVNIASFFAMNVNTANMEFIVYSIGWIIFNLGGGYVTVPFAYIAKMIPHKKAILYQSRIYASIFCAVCIGPVISGLIADYLSYQWSYIIVSIMNGILLIFIIFNNIKNKQSILLNQQSSFLTVYQRIIQDIMDEDELKQIEEEFFFPMTYSEIKKQRNAKIKTERKMKKNVQNESGEQFNSKQSKIAFWTQFIGALLSFSFVNANEVVFDSYYTVYCHDRFGLNISISTIQLSVTSLTLIIGFIFVPQLYEKFPILSKHKLWIMMVLYIALLFLLGIVFPIWMNKNMYFWFVLPGYNMLLASLMMNVEILNLELQPKEASGAVNGIRALFKQLLSAFSILIVSLMWSKGNNYVWMWYGPFIFVAAGFVSCLLLNFIPSLQK
eukprot:555002_1